MRKSNFNAEPQASLHSSQKLIWIENKIGIFMFIIICSAFVAMVFVISYYRMHFPGPILLDHDKWGTFGDYVGGVLNPVLSFLGLIALLFTIILQTRELKETRDELSKSAKSQKNAIILQTILPLMNDMGTDEFAQAVGKMGELWRKEGGFLEDYRCLVNKRNSGAIAPQESLELTKIESARRKISYLFHKLHRLYISNVIDLDAVKAVASPDLADLLIEVIERLNEVFDPQLDRNIYDFARKMYTDKERSSARYLNRILSLNPSP